MDLRLTDRVAVVTGASKGIGLATVRALHAEGATVVATSRSVGPELEALIGPRLVHVPADLMDPAAPEQVVERAVANFGGVDIVVNNAGGPPPGVTIPHGSFLEAKPADWLAVFQLNLFAAVGMVRAALPPLLSRGGGVIVNVSSANARQPSPMNVDYSAAKAALTNLTKALSEEYAPQGIRVNAVSPGPVRTPWWTDEGGAADVIAGFTDSDRDTVMDRLAPEMMRVSVGRMARPEEVAAMVTMLASPLSASTTGADVVVDGGLLKEI